MCIQFVVCMRRDDYFGSGIDKGRLKCPPMKKSKCNIDDMNNWTELSCKPVSSLYTNFINSFYWELNLFSHQLWNIIEMWPETIIFTWIRSICTRNLTMKMKNQRSANPHLGVSITLWTKSITARLLQCLAHVSIHVTLSNCRENSAYEMRT